MSQRPYQLPGLTQLASFEAAARNLSFKKASAELDVTASAISHQVRALEEDLGAQLFDRRRRQISLTQTGHRLFEELQGAFSSIDETVQGIRTDAARYTVGINSNSALASMWLAPRVDRFIKKEQQYFVNALYKTVNSSGKDSADIMMVYGKGIVEQDQAMSLFRDQLVPVAHPNFARRYRDASLSELARLPLISVSEYDPAWVRWPDWFRELGYLGQINESLSAHSYERGLQMAAEGAGVVLGWSHIIQSRLRRGELVVLTNFVVKSHESFYLCSKAGVGNNFAGQALLEYLLRQLDIASNSVSHELL